MAINIKGLEYKVEKIGKTFKSLKSSHLWTLEIDKEVFRVSYVVYRLRKTRKVLLNKTELVCGQKEKLDFSYSFHVHMHIVTVNEGARGVDLYVDGLSFMILHKQKSGPFVHIEETKESSSLSPIRLRESVFSSDTTKEVGQWEQKAKNYRIKPRDIPLGLIREKVPITPKKKVIDELSLSFASEQYKSYSPPSPQSINPELYRQLSVKGTKPSKKKVVSKKNINFFLHI